MQINQQATQALKYMVEFRSIGSVAAVSNFLGTDNYEATSVMKYILRRRKSWFTTIQDAQGDNAFIVTPNHIEDVIRFLDKGGFA